MTGILARLFAHPIDPIEPRIVQLEQPILTVGMGVDTSLRTVFRDVPALGKRLGAYKREHPIPHLKQPWAFAAVSRDFDERTGAFFYFMGDVVSCFDQLPSELTAFEIPVLTYAVFRVRPKNRFGWGIAIANSKRHAYRTWLPVSRYEAAKVIDDFEYHDERSTRKTNPEIELYVAVKERV